MAINFMRSHNFVDGIELDQKNQMNEIIRYIYVDKFNM